MAATKSFFQDRFVLLLLSINLFLTLLAVLLILFRIGSAGSSGFIVQYRTNLGISAYKVGSVTSLIAFIIYAIIIFVTNSLLSWRSYAIRRQLSIIILSLGLLLLLLCIIVSNALLALR
jgi:hypothetical protein